MVRPEGKAWGAAWLVLTMGAGLAGCSLLPGLHDPLSDDGTSELRDMADRTLAAVEKGDRAGLIALQKLGPKYEREAGKRAEWLIAHYQHELKDVHDIKYKDDGILKFEWVTVCLSYGKPERWFAFKLAAPDPIEYDDPLPKEWSLDLDGLPPPPGQERPNPDTKSEIPCAKGLVPWPEY